MPPRPRNARIVVLVLGYLAVAHYCLGLYITTTYMLVSNSPAIYVRFALPYIGITAIFVTAIVLGHMRKLRWSAILLAAGLLVSVAACVYDFHNHRYQASGGGTGHQYFIWWWYYEPFWHGYKPGNL